MRGRKSAALAIAATTIVGFASTVAASTDTTAPADSAPAGTETAGTETAGTATAETGSVAIDAEWWATAAEPYAGTTITGVSESTPPSVYAAETLAAQFEELTGITVELETTSWDEMRNRALNDMESGTGVYDFVYIEQDIAFADISAERLTNLTAHARGERRPPGARILVGQLQHVRRELHRRRRERLRRADGGVHQDLPLSHRPLR